VNFRVAGVALFLIRRLRSAGVMGIVGAGSLLAGFRLAFKVLGFALPVV